MKTIVEKLRGYPLDQHLDLGMAKLRDEAADEIERLQNELRDCAHAIAKRGCNPLEPLAPQIEKIMRENFDLQQRLETEADRFAEVFRAGRHEGAGFPQPDVPPPTQVEIRDLAMLREHQRGFAAGREFERAMKKTEE